MAGNSEQEVANANLARAKHRARGLYDKAEQSLTDPTLPENVRDAARAARNFAALAVMSLSSGQEALGNAVQSFAVECWGEAKRLTLLPAAEYGQSFIEGREKPKPSLLTLLVDDALGALGKRASAAEVFRWIQANHDGKVIQEIEDTPQGPVIHWRARNGREMKTGPGRFGNLLTERRNKI